MVRVLCADDLVTDDLCVELSGYLDFGKTYLVELEEVVKGKGLFKRCRIRLFARELSGKDFVED